MMHGVVAALAIISGISFSGIVRADEEDFPDAPVVDQFSVVRQTLKETFDSPMSCTDFAAAKKNHCDYNGLCSYLAESRNKPYLYKNKNGEVVPNFLLQQAEEQVQRCYMTKKFKKASSNPFDPEVMKANGEKYKKAQIAALRENKAFITLMRQKHEEDVYGALYEATIDKAIADTEKGTGMFMGFYGGTKTREDIDKDLVDAETKSGKKFSPEVRDKYIQAKLAQMNVMGSMGTEPDKDAWVAMNPDPFQNIALFTNQNVAGSKEAVLKNQTRYQTQVDRSYQIFKDAQSSIVEFLKKKRTEDNDSEIDNMIKRISTIKMKPATLDLMMMNGGPFAQCPGPNAFYDPNTHCFVVCPQVMEMPTAALKTIIAHELGHSVDPCILTGRLVSISGKKRENPWATPAQLEEGKKYREKQGIFAYEPKLPAEAERKEDFKVNLFDGDMTASLNMEYETYKKKTVAKGVGMSKHPFATVIDCLRSSESVAARMSDEKEIGKILDEAIDKLKKSGATEETNPLLESLVNGRKNLVGLIKERGACSFIPGSAGKSQVQEAFSDWLAGEVLGNDVSKAETGDSKNAAFESMSFFLAMGCGTTVSDTGKKVRKFLKDQGCDSSQGLVNTLNSIEVADMLNKDEHPWNTERVNKIFLANPSLRKALGCAGTKEVKHCE